MQNFLWIVYSEVFPVIWTLGILIEGLTFFLEIYKEFIYFQLFQHDIIQFPE